MNNTNDPPLTSSNDGKIHITMPSGVTASRLVNHLVPGAKPLGWSRKSNSPYYKEKYARWLQKDIDNMITTRKNLVYRYVNYKSTSPNALYLRINQALRYLCEYLDPNNVYKKFREDVAIHRERTVGITIRFDEVLEDAEQGGEFVDGQKLSSWRTELDEYLESSSTEPFYKGGLILNEKEIDQLKLELDDLSNIMYSVTSSELKVMKGC